MERGSGLPGGDRTPDPQLRRLMLYPTELRADVKKAHEVSFFRMFNGRSTRIRTLDPLVPNQVRYQAAPHSAKLQIIASRIADSSSKQQFFYLAPATHQSLTYSYSTGLALMPRSGGAIHAAILPGSVTRFIRLLTNAVSAGVGSHWSFLASNSAALIGTP